jgi:beta-glucosidase
VKFQLYLDDSLVFRSVYPTRDGEFPDPRLNQSEPIRLEGGRSYRLRIEAQETYGEAQLQFLWSTPHEALESEAVKAAQQADAVVMFLGLTARLEGEEMPVQIEGFRGGDRTSIDLPAVQQALLERIVSIGKPTVLVLLNGSAIAVNWAQEHVPAIVEAWYPGTGGGDGDRRRVVRRLQSRRTLARHVLQKCRRPSAFDDYRMAGRTYRFFNGTPLYPFGHGLSYTTFSYKNLRTSSDRLSANGSITVRVDVTNAGSRAGDEVVQLYAQHVGSKVERPARGSARLSACRAESGSNANRGVCSPGVVVGVLGCCDACLGR